MTPESLTKDRRGNMPPPSGGIASYEAGCPWLAASISVFVPADLRALVPVN